MQARPEGNAGTAGMQCRHKLPLTGHSTGEGGACTHRVHLSGVAGGFSRQQLSVELFILHGSSSSVYRCGDATSEPYRQSDRISAKQINSNELPLPGNTLLPSWNV